MRIEKFLSNMGEGSRREVKNLFRNKAVTVNGQLVKDPSIQIDETKDSICVHGREIAYEPFIYIMLNKPAGVVSATKDNKETTVLELLDEVRKEELFPVGRLDKDTEGLLILTNDGPLAHELLSPKKHVPKKYYAQIDGYVDESTVEAMSKGITLDDGYVCLSANLKILVAHQEQMKSEIEIELFEGKFHQVKRMFESLDMRVAYLKRFQMGQVALDETLTCGEYRRLTEDEIERLKQVYVK